MTITCSYVVTHPDFNISSDKLFPEVQLPGRNRGGNATIET
jgi:hypothetical protein